MLNKIEFFWKSEAAKMMVTVNEQVENLASTSKHTERKPSIAFSRTVTRSAEYSTDIHFHGHLEAEETSWKDSESISTKDI